MFWGTEATTASAGVPASPLMGFGVGKRLGGVRGPSQAGRARRQAALRSQRASLRDVNRALRRRAALDVAKCGSGALPFASGR
mmetsp:Transcript_110559/g.323488  ORF Transcript_110559/g.323488 Transcript_110559/m.323488 type:complete len:83 (-) Transcript_110559:53-301(-)